MGVYENSSLYSFQFTQMDKAPFVVIMYPFLMPFILRFARMLEALYEDKRHQLVQGYMCSYT